MLASIRSFDSTSFHHRMVCYMRRHICVIFYDLLFACCPMWGKNQFTVMLEISAAIS